MVGTFAGFIRVRVFYGFVTDTYFYKTVVLVRHLMKLHLACFVEH